jgi:putative hydroxymethylpyrimidine transport system substrate-binding protein
VRPRRLLLVLLTAVGIAGCGAAGQATDQSATILLDFTPNAVHTGLYTARARGFDTGEGVDMKIREPAGGADGVKLLTSDRVDFAVLDIHDLALARARGRDLVGFYALVQRPLASVIAQPGTRSPAALASKRVGVTGLPSDSAVLSSVVTGAGGNPRRVRETTIGFDAVSALLARKVAAATAFWNVEGVALERRRPGFRIFKVDEFGAPPYPELVVTATRSTVRERPQVVRGLVRALRRGYRQVLDDPETSVSELLDRTRGLDRDQVQAELDAVSPSFLPPNGGRIGELSRARLERWAAWEARFGIVRRPPDVNRAFFGLSR